MQLKRVAFPDVQTCSAGWLPAAAIQTGAVDIIMDLISIREFLLKKFNSPRF